ncbi:glycosyltransferase family 4 protein [Methylococcus capsulatus]|uniref:glycosyltransferase family 4 protein n=1 Tax=Methylococcus capsulatus TaxID=414 RepID=UPI001C52EDBA|nr:glycosyltransferase family 4 protein [Methylococcus capsulatus]QXP94872.1 glycosyltransferase family 4 protein [Methylococcus capsulatus]
MITTGKLAVSSPLGNPRDPGTWSGAPANLCAALERRGVQIAAIDSTCFGLHEKVLMAAGNLARGYPWNAVAWFGPARRRRASYVANRAREAGADMVLCTSTLDVPLGMDVPYAIWLDNSWNLYRNGRTAPSYGTRACDEIDRLERASLAGAARVLTFSEHVRDDIVGHYGVPPERVFAVGCGSGDLPGFEGEKDFAEGHLLFVAKHLFVPKGGELVLEAFEIIRRKRPQTRLVVVGSDEIVARIKGRPGVEAHGFVSRERLIGFFHDAAMLVQPMLADPWGQVYLEAMKARALVVSLRVAAVPELTDNGRLGILASEASAQSLAEAVLAAYARPQGELDNMAREAQERALRHYDWDVVAERVLGALEGVSGTWRVS